MLIFVKLIFGVNWMKRSGLDERDHFEELINAAGWKIGFDVSAR